MFLLYFFYLLVHRVLSILSLFSIGGLWWWTRKLDIPPALRLLMGNSIGIAAVQVLHSIAPRIKIAGGLELMVFVIY